MMAEPLPSFDPDFAGNAEWAAMYRACGMQVVPARFPMRTKDDKRPDLSTWAEFHNPPLAPDAAFARWFPTGCHPNMGLVTGRASRNTFIIDLDQHNNPEAAFWWRAVLEIHADGIEPETWKQTTGGGGRQLAFEAPESWHAPTNKTARGVDIRGQGGFAMLPPSKHLSGGTYTWDEGFAPWECELAKAPDWLLQAVDDLVAEAGGDKKGEGRAERVQHTGNDFDAFGARVDGREDALSKWAWRTVVEMHAETGGVIPDDGGLSRFQASGEHWLRHAKTRLRGVDNAVGLERECRGASALIAKCQRAMRKWDGRIREDAQSQRPFGGGETGDYPGGGGASGGPANDDGAEFQSSGETGAKPVELLPIIPAVPFDPSAIPTRDWEIPGLLLRRHLSVLVAPPGSGKSLLTLQTALARCSGRPWGGWRINGAGKALILNSEDDHDEMRRRLHGAMQVMGISQADVAGRMFLVETPESVVITRTDPKSKAVLRLPLMDRLIATIEANGITLVVVDPFAETFEGDENSNSEVKWAGIAWREIARRTNTSVWLVHHTRKYASGMAGEADASRGGGALIGTARIVSTLFGMTEEEAGTMNVSPEERTQFVRFDDAKANLSLVTGAAKWFRKASVQIPNGGLGVGDEVGALVPWEPPGMLDGVSLRTIGQALDVIERGILDEDGSPTGRLFTASAAGASNTRWAGQKIAELFACEPDRVRKILKAWLKSGLLVEVEYHDPADRKERKGLRVDRTKMPTGA